MTHVKALLLRRMRIRRDVWLSGLVDVFDLPIKIKEAKSFYTF